MSYHTTINGQQIGEIDYKIGDMVIGSDGINKGFCTGFTHNDTCILINGKCYGGKFYFHKSDYEDVECEDVTNKH